MTGLVKRYLQGILQPASSAASRSARSSSRDRRRRCAADRTGRARKGARTVRRTSVRPERRSDESVERPCRQVHRRVLAMRVVCTSASTAGWCTLSSMCPEPTDIRESLPISNRPGRCDRRAGNNDPQGAGDLDRAGTRRRSLWEPKGGEREGRREVEEGRRETGAANRRHEAQIDEGTRAEGQWGTGARQGNGQKDRTQGGEGTRRGGCGGWGGGGGGGAGGGGNGRGVGGCGGGGGGGVGGNKIRDRRGGGERGGGGGEQETERNERETAGGVGCGCGR